MKNFVVHSCARGARVLRNRVVDIGQRVYLATGTEPRADLAPNFLIIGAMKAGTTALHDCLAQHPDLYMTYVKEPSYFLNESEASKHNGIATRRQLRKLMFKGYRNEPYIGESSTTYTEAPTVGKDVPENIHAEVPDMRFIYILRNPLARIVSHYMHCVERGIYREPITEVLSRDSTFLERSLYHAQLERYLEFFKKDQFLILFFEDFIKEPKPSLRRVCQFLNIDEAPVDRIGVKASNRSIVAASVRVGNSQFTPEAYTTLMQRVGADVRQLEEFVGHPIAQWDLSEAKWTSAKPESTKDAAIVPANK